jgi:hypothetical protein
MPSLDRNAALNLIRSNVTQFGHHIYLVTPSSSLPRFAYTVGLSIRAGVELVLAGAAVYSADEVNKIINEIAQRLHKESDAEQMTIELDSLGSFLLRGVDATWSRSLMLGVKDFFGHESVPALQIVPDQSHWTIDIPNLSEPWSALLEPAWQWLHAPWTPPVPSGSIATTNLAALRGEAITEAARWEQDQWELFAGAGPDVPEDQIRVVPLGTLLAFDGSLVQVTQLDVGRAVWRASRSDVWHPWERSN